MARRNPGPKPAAARRASAASIHEAHALFQRGEVKAAANACRQRLKVDKHDVRALVLLGLALGALGRYREAQRAFDTALRASTRPNATSTMPAAEIHNHAGRVFLAAGDYDAALREFDAGLAVDPTEPGVLAGKAQVLCRRGAYDAARSLLEPAVTAQRDDSEIANIYAETLRHDGRHDDAIALLERHLADDALAEIPRRKLCFALGKSLDAVGESDRAFAAYTSGNAIGAVPYDALGTSDAYNRLMTTFSRARLAELPRSSNDSDVPIFVVGMPRCGSTLVEQIISAHPDAHGIGEVQDVLNVIGTLPKHARSRQVFPEVVDDLDRGALDRVSRQLVAGMQRRAPNAARIVDKMLGNFRFLGLIQLLLPNARIIHCTRDPIATCCSIYMLPLDPAAVPYSTDLRHLGHAYREYQRMMRHWRNVLDLPILEVEYETLVTDQESTTRTLIEFCGLPWSDDCLRFHEQQRDVATASFDQVRRPLYTSAVNRYAGYDSHLAPLRGALGL